MFFISNAETDIQFLSGTNLRLCPVGMYISCKRLFISRYLNKFLDEFNRVLSTKLLCAKQNAEENETKLNGLSTELEKLEKSREEVFSISSKFLVKTKFGDKKINIIVAIVECYIPDFVRVW